MAVKNGALDISAELAALKHERKNHKMKNLPPNMTIQRRPLHHPPVTSAYAGSHIPKVVYVSSHTPIMSAVKRVKKFLSEIEKRAVQGAKAKSKDTVPTMAELAEISDRLAKANEEILVKASGRAMQQALRVGEWFRSKEKDISCKVEIRTSSVAAIDDIVETEIDEALVGTGEHQDDEQEQPEETAISTTLEGGETTMELLGNTTDSATHNCDSTAPHSTEKGTQLVKEESDQRKKKKRFRRKRAVYGASDVPEARIRWVKSVEVAISLKA